MQGADHLEGFADDTSLDECLLIVTFTHLHTIAQLNPCTLERMETSTFPYHLTSALTACIYVHIMCPGGVCIEATKQSHELCRELGEWLRVMLAEHALRQHGQRTRGCC